MNLTHLRVPWWLAALVVAGGLIADPAGAADAPAGTVADTLAQRAKACTVCHGREGRASSSGYFPRIAGKPAGYLYNQLVAFREGRRVNDVMTALLDVLSDDYLREIAGYFGSLDLPYPPPQTVSLDALSQERARALVQDGNAASGVPGCVACHGTKLTGTLPSVPGLLGLPRDYLLAQFGAWRTGQRHALAPDCMADVAKRLSPGDVSLVAAWLASQPVPDDAHPAAAAAAPPREFECGSGLR